MNSTDLRQTKWMRSEVEAKQDKASSQAPGEALETAIKALAKAWRNLLGNSDGALGIDGDFTRPGIEALLNELQNKFEESDAAGDFDFNWRG